MCSFSSLLFFSHIEIETQWVFKEMRSTQWNLFEKKYKDINENLFQRPMDTVDY